MPVRAWWYSAVLAVAEASSFGQAPAGEFRLVPSTFPRFMDTTVEGPSMNYLFSPVRPSFAASPRLEFRLPWNAEQHTFLFGPEFHVRVGRGIGVNGWAVGGVAKRFALMDALAEPTDATPPHFGSPTTPAFLPAFNGANETAVSFGGSVDYRIGDWFRYRIVQTEYLDLPSLYMPVKNAARGSLRVSTGLRLSFGK